MDVDDELLNFQFVAAMLENGHLLGILSLPPTAVPFNWKFMLAML